MYYFLLGEYTYRRIRMCPSVFVFGKSWPSRRNWDEILYD